MSALTAFGVSDGLAWSIRATVPDTTGAAMLVPVRLRYGLCADGIDPASRYGASVVYSVLPNAAVETTPVPGATTSGFAIRSVIVGPRELYGAIVSSLRVTVPFVEEAPTVSTHGAFPGAVIAP